MFKPYLFCSNYRKKGLQVVQIDLAGGDPPVRLGLTATSPSRFSSKAEVTVVLAICNVYKSMLNIQSSGWF